MFTLLPCFKVIPVLNVIRVDHDQTAASDLGLHCLPTFLLGDDRITRFPELIYRHFIWC